MKKKTIIALCAAGLVLASCGKSSNVDENAPITAETSIESKAQAAKVCAPFIKYLECSLDKAAPARKEVHEKILEETKRKIENDAPDRIAQQCDTYIKILKENPEIAFKNGCNLETVTPVPVPAPTEVKK
ncbi:hypothetical protein KA057_00295 [Candidatus Gracilibacteria bacterium]|jgi:hypothetical protein|nr:hypothetical protein [Candidatus Gracilibacteria bacterium]